jgi:hypothetical protein
VIKRNGEDRVVVGKGADVLAVDDSGQRVDRLVLDKNAVAVSRQCPAERRSSAWARPDDDPLRLRRAVLENRSERRIEAHGATFGQLTARRVRWRAGS